MGAKFKIAIYGLKSDDFKKGRIDVKKQSEMFKKKITKGAFLKKKSNFPTHLHTIHIIV